MGQTREDSTANLAARWGWEVARRDDVRVARRLCRKHVIDGVYRLDEGALLDDFCPLLEAVGVRPWLSDSHGPAVPRERVPVGPYVLLSGLKPLLGIERLPALPPVLFSEEALRRLVGFNAPQGRQGVGPRGAATRQGERPPGPSGPDTLAQQSVTRNLRALEAGFKGALRARAQARGLQAKVTGRAEGPDLETPAREAGGGQVTRPSRSAEQRGRGPALAVTVYGGKVLLVIAAATKMPLAVKVGQMHAHEALWPRALVTQARPQLAGAARRPKGVVERAFLAGPDLWGLDPHGSRVVVPAKATRAVTADARAPAAARAGLTSGGRGHPGRHGQGRAAWTERRETAGGGMTALPPDDHYGTPTPGRPHPRQDFQPHPSPAGVVRQWKGREDGPGGNPVFLTNASGAKPLPPFDADDDRRRIEPCGLKEAKPPGDLGPPPQNSARAVRGPGTFTRLRVALAPAYRLPCEREATAKEPVGGQRWRRPLLEQPRELVLVFADGG
jgi:hypothetical protein